MNAPTSRAARWTLATRVIRSIKASELNDPLSVLERAYDISISVPTLSKLQHCDWVIEPASVDGYAMFDLRYIDEIYQIGYESAMKVLSKGEVKGGV